MSLNRVNLVGHLGNDPEVRSFSNGGSVCSFTMATSQKWKDRGTGEQRERTEWHRVSIFNEGLIRVAQQYLSKGSKVFIEGQLETRKWQDQSGADRYSTEVVLRPYNGKIELMGGGGGQSGGGRADPPPQHDPGMDDEIPF